MDDIFCKAHCYYATVLKDCGLVYMRYILDSGISKTSLFLQLSLFFDILLCMTADIEEEEFVSGQSRAGPAQQPSAVMRRARTHLWNTFSGTKMRAGG